MTALTVRGSSTASTTLAIAGQMYTTTTATAGNVTTKVGTSTGRKPVYAKGFSGTSLTGVGSIPAPTDSNFVGWIFDVTTLEGQEIAAGTWTPTFNMLASTGTTVTPTVEWFKRSSAGVYTSIGSVTGSSIALTTSSQALTFTPPSCALMDFSTGDKLCCWLWINQTAGGAANSTVTVVESATTAGSSTAAAQTATPGYAPSPVALSVTMAGVGTLTGRIAAGAYALAVMTNSPIRYHRLGEASGTVAHDLGSQGQDGTLHGGVTIGVTGLLVGDSDTAMSFNGGSGYINASVTGLPTGASAWSMEAWASYSTLAGLNANEAVISFGTANTNKMALILYENATGEWKLEDWTGVVISASAAVVAGNIYHLAATYDGTTAHFYINGVEQGTGATHTFAITAGVFQIGNDSATDWSSAVIDEPALYNYALTSAQVLADYNAGITATLQTTFAGVGTLTAPFTLATSLTDTMSGVGTLTATLTETTALTKTLAGVGILSETFSLATALSTTLAGVGQLLPTLKASLDLGSVTIRGVGTLPGTMSANTALSSTIAGVGTLAGVLGTTGAVALAGTMAGMGTLSETLSATTALIVTLAGSGLLSGTLTEGPALATTIAGAGILTPTLGANTALSCTLAGVGTLAGTLGDASALSSTIAGVGTLSGTLTERTALAVSLVGTGTLSGALSAHLMLASVTMAGTGTLAATMSAQTALAVSLVGASTLSGVFSLRAALSLTFAGVGMLLSNITVLGTTIQYPTAVWVTRDLHAAWVTRDEHASWDSRDERATAWKAR